MSTISVSNISDGAATYPATAVIEGGSATWRYNQSGPTVDASYNVTSFTDNSAGNHTVNLTNSMGSATYSAGGVGGVLNISATVVEEAIAVSSYQRSTVNSSGTAGDDESTGAIWGELA